MDFLGRMETGLAGVRAWSYSGVVGVSWRKLQGAKV